MNPVHVGGETSDLGRAQPVTFASMTQARAWAELTAPGRVEVRFFSSQFAEDRPAVPPGFEALPDLARSVLDVGGPFAVPRRLPLLGDILGPAAIAARAAGCETLIYTNVDIALMPDFYLAVAALFDGGREAFTVNRRTVAKEGWPGGAADLPLMRAQVGEAHPGRDCFVFPAALGAGLDLGTACIGAQYVGKVLAANLLVAVPAERYEDFADLHLSFHLGADRPWLSSRFDDYNQHNRRELAAVLRRLRAAGRVSVHPEFTGMEARFR